MLWNKIHRKKTTPRQIEKCIENYGYNGAIAEEFNCLQHNIVKICEKILILQTKFYFRKVVFSV
jgi:hypothetical protein